ncbi:MAG: hypothetical protein LBI20_03250 [Holosporales bacterium]|nr:hypothetical protein [Holosporales bacterium]
MNKISMYSVIVSLLTGFVAASDEVSTPPEGEAPVVAPGTDQDTGEVTSDPSSPKSDPAEPKKDTRKKKKKGKLHRKDKSSKIKGRGDGCADALNAGGPTPEDPPAAPEPESAGGSSDAKQPPSDESDS